MSNRSDFREPLLNYAQLHSLAEARSIPRTPTVLVSAAPEQEPGIDQEPLAFMVVDRQAEPGELDRDSSPHRLTAAAGDRGELLLVRLDPVELHAARADAPERELWLGPERSSGGRRSDRARRACVFLSWVPTTATSQIVYGFSSIGNGEAAWSWPASLAGARPCGSRAPGASLVVSPLLGTAIGTEQDGAVTHPGNSEDQGLAGFAVVAADCWDHACYAADGAKTRLRRAVIFRIFILHLGFLTLGVHLSFFPFRLAAGLEKQIYRRAPCWQRGARFAFIGQVEASARGWGCGGLPGVGSRITFAIIESPIFRAAQALASSGRLFFSDYCTAWSTQP